MTVTSLPRVSLGHRRMLERERVRMHAERARIAEMAAAEIGVSDTRIYSAWLDSQDSVVHAAAVCGVGVGRVRAVLRRAGILTATAIA